jgi:molybdenum cofactor cytidylyltransferase
MLAGAGRILLFVSRSAPTVIVLAAGQGSRFKGSEHKLAMPLFGSTVLGCTLRNAVESRLPVLLVTTAPFVAEASKLLPMRDIVVLPAAEARRGMGHTIASGVSERASATGWLMLPGDMPLTRPSTLRAVAAALERHPVVYAQHRGRRGHPVGFAAELFSELVLLDGDDGAKRIVARYPVHGEETDDPGVLLDVDTQEDLASMRSHEAATPPASPVSAERSPSA